MRFRRLFPLLAVMILAAANCPAAPESGERLRFRVLSDKTDSPPPFAQVDVVYGPQETVGVRQYQWWQIEVRADADRSSAPLCVVRFLTSADPLDPARPSLQIARYELQVPATSEALEYVEAHTGQPLLPAWENFQKYFLPHSVASARRPDGMPQTCEYLGQVLSLQGIDLDVWPVLAGLKRLTLDREMLIGTGRNFKDREGRRLLQAPTPQEYTYIDFNGQDYRTMIDAGMNLFTIAPSQEQWVRDEPVFYYCTDYAKPAPRFPTDLYRANYLGAGMFMDEPASVMTWDKSVTGLLQHFSDAAALIESRTRATYDSGDLYYGRFGLEKQLTDHGVNLGGMRLAQIELPVWETQYDRTHYLMKGGGSGMVHEGRYQLDEFNERVEAANGKPAHYTATQMLRYYYAYLRGGSKPFSKDWGTAIYGQCDPAIAPEAFTLAYDMGARFFWFWTSDHAHHVPWGEQVASSRRLMLYAQDHPRPSIYAPPAERGAAIVIPNGYFVSFGDLSWLGCLGNDGKTLESLRYHDIMRQTLEAVDQCFRTGEDFDIVIDDGHPITGYRRMIPVGQ